MTPEAFAAALEATWPPAATRSFGPWRLREGRGGGKRVSAASAEGAWTGPDIVLAEAAMQAMDQDQLFVLRPGEEALDAALAARGYRVIDPVVGYAAPVAAFPPPARMTAFAHWPPMQIARDIWAEGGIGPARVAVMERAEGPRAAILSRSLDHPSGAGFVAIHAGVAMLHAVEVRPALRRQGAGRAIVLAAAEWAAGQGAAELALAVTAANQSARALYASLGMQVVGQYHYRIR